MSIDIFSYIESKSYINKSIPKILKLEISENT